MIRWS